MKAKTRMRSGQIGIAVMFARLSLHCFRQTRAIMRMIPVVLASVMSLTSCTVMYKPNMSNVPMFLEKGEMQTSVTWEDLQLAYTPVKGLGFAVNGFYHHRRPYHLDDGKTSDYEVRNSCIDGTVGFYTVGNKSSFECFAGFGRGYSSVSYREDRYRSGGSSHYNKFYLQPDVVLGTTKRMKLALSLRVTRVHFADLPTPPYPGVAKKDFTFIEPSLTFREDLGLVSLLGQMQYSAVSNEEDFVYGHFVPFHDRLALKVAVQFRLHKIIERL